MRETIQDRPITFSADMVRAALDDRKTQTRRVMKRQPPASDNANPNFRGYVRGLDGRWRQHFQSDPPSEDPRFAGGVFLGHGLRCPYGRVGDRLYVKEAFRLHRVRDHQSPAEACAEAREPLLVQYLADWTEPDDPFWEPGRYRHDRFMPRALSRLTLEITEVRVERVQEISDADAVAEGCCAAPGRCADYYAERGVHRRKFSRLWDKINARRGHGWEANPHVWVIGFKRVTDPVGLGVTHPLADNLAPEVAATDG